MSVKTKPDSLTTEQYRDLVKMLRDEGWALLQFADLKRDEVRLLHHTGLVQKVKYEERQETRGTICERH